MKDNKCFSGNYTDNSVVLHGAIVCAGIVQNSYIISEQCPRILECLESLGEKFSTPKRKMSILVKRANKIKENISKIEDSE